MLGGVTDDVAGTATGGAAQSPRRSAAETRRLMLDAGMERLAATGLEPSMEQFSIEQALRDASVPRSSAYNAWTGLVADCTPQEAYQRELIHHAISTGPGAGRMDVLIDQASPLLARADSIDRAVLEKELIRIAGEAHYQSCLADQALVVGLALLASATTTDSTLADDIVTWSAEAETRWRTRLIEQIFRPFMTYMGRRPKPEFDPDLVWDQFVTALNALGAGILPRTRLVDDEVLYGIERPGPDGDVRQWSLFAVVLEGLIDTFFEQAPEEEP